MRPALLVAILLLAPLAGCTTAPDGTEPGANSNYRVSGAFDANATQQDFDRVDGIAAAHGGTLQLMESFPERYTVSGLTGVACQKVADALRGEPHVASVGACTPVGGV